MRTGHHIRQDLFISQQYQSYKNQMQQQSSVFGLLTSMFNPKVARGWTKISEEFAVSNEHSFEMGKYGRVQLGYAFFYNRMVAVKVMEKVQNYQHEVQVLQRNAMLDHLYVMRFYGYCFWQDKVYIFLEVCPYGTLSQRINNKMTQMQVLRAFRQLVQGVRYLHENNKIHKDLKPENILLGPEKDVKICDYGLTNEDSESIYESGFLGTAQYSAPEVFLFEGEPEDVHSPKSDVWSIGSILFQMLTGRYVYENAKNYDELKQEWLKLQRGNNSIRVLKFNETIHPIWEYYINWLMTFRKESRPNIQQVYQSLCIIYPHMRKDLSQRKHEFPYELSRHVERLKSQIYNYQFLLELSETFTAEDIRLRNEFKYMMMLCLIMRFLTFCKNFLPKMVNIPLKVQNRMNQGQTYLSPYGELMMVKERIQLQQKYYFYRRQVQKVIIPKILDVYCKRQQSNLLMDDMRTIVDEVKRFKTQKTESYEELYDQAMQSILRVIERRHGDVTKIYKRNELIIFGKILLAMLLTDKYLKNDQESLSLDIQKLEDLPEEELAKHVKKLSEEVC